MTTHASIVPNHLIREIMHAIQLHGTGDAMGCLAISSKDAFSVFKYVISHDVIGCLVNKNDIESIKNPLLRSTLGRNVDLNEVEVYRTLQIEFNTEALHTIATRYLRKLRVNLRGTIDLPELHLENDITELSVSGCFYHDEPSLIPILDSWESLQSFKIYGLIGNSIDLVRSAVLKSKNLSRLEFEVDRYQLENLLTKTPTFPFPEIVTLHCVFGFNDPINLASTQTFPQVKQLNLQCSSKSPLTYTFFKKLRDIVHCFPSLETAKIVFNSRETFSHFVDDEDFTKCHEWFNDVNFTVPVEITYNDAIEFMYEDDLTPVYEYLISLGFIKFGYSYCYEIKKEDPNVKLVHQITAYYSDNEETLQHNEAMGYMYDLDDYDLDDSDLDYYDVDVFDDI